MPRDLLGDGVPVALDCLELLEGRVKSADQAAATFAALCETEAATPHDRRLSAAYAKEAANWRAIQRTVLGGYTVDHETAAAPRRAMPDILWASPPLDAQSRQRRDDTDRLVSMLERMEPPRRPSLRERVRTWIDCLWADGLPVDGLGERP